jgi:hypothetical protein
MSQLKYFVIRQFFQFIILLTVCFSSFGQTSRDSLHTGHLTDAAEEYWPELNDTLRNHFFQKIKHLSVSEGRGIISIGGTLREGYEVFDNYLWGIGTQDDNGYLLHRLLLHTDLRWKRSLRFFGEVENSLAIERKGGPRPVQDENQLAVIQAFLELSVRPGTISSLKLRLGKQALNYGVGSLLDIRDANVRLSFAGGKLIFENNQTKIDVFGMEAIKNNNGIFDDELNHSQKIAGIWMTHHIRTFFTKADAYFIFIDRNGSHYDQRFGNESRNTIGGDIWFLKGNFSGYTEATFQWGHFNDESIVAWKAVQSLFYKFANLKWAPVLSIHCAISSGDQNPGDDQLQTFNPIYPKAIYYGFVDNVGSANMVALHGKLEASISKRFKVTLGYYKFWREWSNDGVYYANGTLLLPKSNAGLHVADMYDVNISYAPSSNITLQFISTYANRSAFLEQQPLTSGDIYYAGIRSNILF